MDSTLRSADRSARAAPEDPGAQRALAVAAERAGDARAAWRARAALARATDAHADWRAIDTRRAPREPARVTRVTLAPGTRLVGLGRDELVLVRSEQGVHQLACEGLDRTERWQHPRPHDHVVACGPDWLHWEGLDLVLVDAQGRDVERGRLDAGSRPDRPPGFINHVLVGGDRVIAWHWTSDAQGARSIVAVGTGFGRLLGHRLLEPREWSHHGDWTHVRGDSVLTARCRGPVAPELHSHDVIVEPLGCREAAGPVAPRWSADRERLVAADEGTVLTIATEAPWHLFERDLRTGERRWSRPLDVPHEVIGSTPDRLVLRRVDRIVAWGRADPRALAWETTAGDPGPCRVVGPDVVSVERVRSATGRAQGTWLVVRAVADGSERWRAPLKGLGNGSLDGLPLIVGDGVVGVQRGGHVIVVSELAP